MSGSNGGMPGGTRNISPYTGSPGGVSTGAPAPKPGIGQRFLQAVNYAISGVTPQTWFSPMQPLQPMAPGEVKGRQWDYPVAFNLNYIPRTSEPIKFSTLKTLSVANNIVRGVIETRKDQVEALDWHIVPRATGLEKKRIREDRHDEIYEITKFFAESPSRGLDWGQWIRGILEQHYVYDAVAVHRRKNRGGKLLELQQLDASTVTILIDADGRIPLPPDPAYQQVLKGIPAADYSAFTTGDLIYAIKNYRTDHMYGFGPVEQTIAYVEMAIARMREQMAYYTTGDVPRGVMEASPNLTFEQVEAVQAYWESIFAGNIEQRSRLWWVPSGSKFTEFKKEVLFDQFDEWLARVICYAFSINPQPFVKMMNRGTAQVSQEQSAQEGLLPTSQWISRFMSKIIRSDWGCDDLIFAWKVRDELDPSKQAVISTSYVKVGVMKIDEAREQIGLDPQGGAAGELMALTANGYVPIDPEEQQDLQVQGQTEQLKAQAKFGPKPVPGQPPGKPGQPGAAGPGQSMGGKLGGPPSNGSGPAKGPPAAGAGMSDRFSKVEGIEIASVERPLFNLMDLRAWAASQGLSLANEVALTLSSFVTGGVPLMPDAMTLNDFLPIVVVDGGDRRLEYDEAGTWLVFESAMLAGESACFQNLGDADLRILVSHDNDLLDQPMNAFEPQLEIDEKMPYTGMLLFGEMTFDVDPWGLAKLSAEDLAKVKGWKSEVTNKDVEHAADETNPDPTDAQRKSGNYKKGQLDFHGLSVSIENAKGSIREGRHDGWSVEMPAVYGYINGTVDADGDETDVFIGKHPDSTKVYIIDQIDDDGKFDEHKTFLGYKHWAHAQADYIDSYRNAENKDKPHMGHHNIGSITEMTIPEYKGWLVSGTTKEPMSPYIKKMRLRKQWVY